ncbi:DUF3830 family protein [Verticiella sediminum]|uniref:DUF3830 family protein n=1 Tax=Verticiella sediminum TaxID=1247510 RepID=A0A556A994_9BURK|nr:DUF3830 family protein [Verticiella sediminum]
MSRIRITTAGHQFVAETHPDAPLTVAAFEKLLPYRQRIIHVRWSGEGCWIPLGDFKLGPGHERRRGLTEGSDPIALWAARAARMGSDPAGQTPTPAAGLS